VALTTPENVDVEKYAKVIDRPDKRLIMENALVKVLD